jgi:hypothetical protein
VASPKDDIRADHLLDQVQERRIEGEIEKGLMAAPILRLLSASMNSSGEALPFRFAVPAI